MDTERWGYGGGTYDGNGDGAAVAVVIPYENMWYWPETDDLCLGIAFKMSPEAAKSVHNQIIERIMRD